MACLKTHELQAEREKKRGREAVCAGRKCRSVPCHAAAQTTLEQMNPFHLLLWQLPHGAPGRRGRRREGRRVARGLRYEGQGEENDRTENGRWWKGAACWVAVMMSEGYRKGEQNAHGSERKTKLWPYNGRQEGGGGEKIPHCVQRAGVIVMFSFFRLLLNNEDDLWPDSLLHIVQR